MSMRTGQRWLRREVWTRKWGTLGALTLSFLAWPFCSSPSWDLPMQLLQVLLYMTPSVRCSFLVFMGFKGRLRDTLTAARTKSGRAVMVAALLGGPVGMTGYLDRDQQYWAGLHR